MKFKKKFTVGFLFNGDLSQVLLIEKKRPEWQAGKLNGVGGSYAPFEKSCMGMAREFKEEAGIHDLPWYKVCTLFFTDVKLVVFTALNQQAFDGAKSMTDEQLVRCSTEDVLNRRLNTIGNTPELLSLCLRYWRSPGDKG